MEGSLAIGEPENDELLPLAPLAKLEAPPLPPPPASNAFAALAGFLMGAAGMFAVMYSTQAILPELSRDFGQIGRIVCGADVQLRYRPQGGRGAVDRRVRR